MTTPKLTEKRQLAPSGWPTRTVEWCPGNGTRYLCVISCVYAGDAAPALLLTWLRNGDSGGPSVLLQPWATVSLGYVCEKMQINEADGAALLALLDKACAMLVVMPDAYDSNGCLRSPH